MTYMPYAGYGKDAGGKLLTLLSEIPAEKVLVFLHIHVRTYVCTCDIHMHMLVCMHVCNTHACVCCMFV